MVIRDMLCGMLIIPCHQNPPLLRYQRCQPVYQTTLLLANSFEDCQELQPVTWSEATRSAHLPKGFLTHDAAARAIADPIVSISGTYLGILLLVHCFETARLLQPKCVSSIVHPLTSCMHVGRA